MPDTERTTIDLAALEAPRPTVTFPVRAGGRTLPVEPIDGIGMQLQREADRKRREEMDASGYYDLAAHVVPDASREEIDALTPGQVAGIIAIACDQVAEVQAILKNAAGPSQPTSATTARRSRSRRSTR